ncbi:MAG: hypothetical protein GF344_05050 [Chitinivibrionales bacterium]|nr:hypothetical protein [Chitinivibrionales bacterium]MBD3356366.1 hypothetical protein [Chitinivibrionales bacterium]
MHGEVDTYAYGSSPIHRWDPRLKIVSFSLLMGVTTSLSSSWALGWAAVAALLSPALSGIPFLYIARRLNYPVRLLLLMTFSLMLTAGGESLGCFGPVQLSYEGLMLALVIAVRALAVLVMFMVVLETAPLSSSIRALSALKVPPKLVAIIFFAVRFMYLYVDDLRRMRTALKLRGYGRAGPIAGMAGNAGVVGSLLVRSFEHADRIDTAMKLRGFTGEFLPDGQFKARTSDYLKATVIIVFVALLVVSESFDMSMVICGG